MPLLSMAQYARHRGVSKMTVTRWVRDAKISWIEKEGHKFIDTEVADRQVQVQTREGLPVEAKTAPREPVGVKGAEETGGGRDDLPANASTSLTKNRAVKEHFNARLAKLAYEQRSGKVVEVEDVQKDAFIIARRVRDMLMSIPDRVAAELAAETNQFKIHAKLTAEIRKTLIGLKDLVNEQSEELRENQEAPPPTKPEV